jgi:hypothetical protein
MKKILLTSLVLMVIGTLAHASGKKHVHGEGRLNAAIDKGDLTLSLELPLDSAVGFERKPRSEREKTALETAEKTLREAGTLWLINSTAGCQLLTAQVGMPKFDGGHADIEATYVYKCSNFADLKTVETSLFKSFKRLYRLDVQQVGSKNQGATRLTPKNPVLRW